MKFVSGLVVLGLLSTACSGSQTEDTNARVSAKMMADSGNADELPVVPLSQTNEADGGEPVDVQDATVPDEPAPDASDLDASLPEITPLDATPPDTGAALVAPDSAADAETDAGLSLDRRVLAKIYECGAVGEGFYQRPAIVDDLMRCKAQCWLEASCDDVRAQLCGDEAPDLQYCWSSCMPSPIAQPFSCVGIEQIVWAGSVCDGVSQCQNSADEMGCPQFNCATGDQTINAARRCNGIRNCTDGSDEDGCADTCPGGNQI